MNTTLVKWIYTKALLTRTVTVFAYFLRAPSIFRLATFEISPVDLKVPALQICRNYGGSLRHLKIDLTREHDFTVNGIFAIKKVTC